MNDVFSKFQESLGKLSPVVEGSRVEILLRLLEPEISRLLRLCAIPHEFDPCLLPILSPGLANAEQLFEKLTRIPFITITTEDAAIHDQIRRELFNSWLKAENKDSFAPVSKRLASYFETRMSSVDGRQRQRFAMKRMFHLIGADPGNGFEEFEILCRTARYQNRFSDCHGLIRLVHEYDSTLSAPLRSMLAYHEAKLAADLYQWESAELLLTKIVDDGSVGPELRSKALFRLGVIHSDQGKNQTAVEHYKGALALLSQLPYETRLTYRVLGALGASYRELNQLTEAQAILEKSLAQAEMMDDHSAVATIQNSLGTLHSKLGDPKRAIVGYTRSLECLDKTCDRYRAAQVHNNLGTVYANQGDWQKAEQHYQNSLEISREGGDTWGQAKVLSNLSRLYQALKTPDKAADVCQQAISIFKELRDSRNEALAQRNLGRLYLASQRAEDSRAAFENAIALFQSSSCLNEATTTEQELSALSQEVDVPSWAWAAVITFALLILAVVLVV